MSRNRMNRTITQTKSNVLYSDNGEVYVVKGMKRTKDNYSKKQFKVLN